MEREYDELRLIRAAQGGDRDAFAQLYEANVERVYHYLLGRLHSHADAEDVTAEVFIRAIEALPAFRPQGVPLAAWLIRIAHNVSVNFVVKQRRQKELPLTEAASISEDPAEEAISKMESDEVLQAMDNLTELQRQVLDHRFIRQLSITETAERMDRSESAVKFLQHSALRALRRVISHQRMWDRVREPEPGL